MLKLILTLATLAAPHKTKLAVLDVVDVAGNEAATARLVTQVLVGETPKLGKFEVISSSDVTQLLGFERQRQLLGCKEDSCLAELGGALGVDYLVTSQLGKL